MCCGSPRGTHGGAEVDPPTLFSVPSHCPPPAPPLCRQAGRQEATGDFGSVHADREAGLKPEQLHGADQETEPEVSAQSEDSDTDSAFVFSLFPEQTPASASASAPFRVPDDSSETSVTLPLRTSLLSSPSSPRGAWHQCPSHRQMEPTLTPLFACGDAKRINA
ncbi:hypothetical protein INR49_024006 [Caranx melampygus]|nr:hypothetical protein INR49_024006 [Caranx melampygus]